MVPMPVPSTEMEPVWDCGRKEGDFEATDPSLGSMPSELKMAPL